MSTKKPTANQLKWLFDHQIPIDIDLTFDEASTLISEAIAEDQRERADRLQKSEELKLLYPPGTEIIHPYFGNGVVLPDDAQTKSTMIKIKFFARPTPMRLNLYYGKFWRKGEDRPVSDWEEEEID